MWTLDDLKKNFENRSEVKSWMILQEHVKRKERYFMNPVNSSEDSFLLDQDREVQAQNITCRIMVKKDDESRQGEVVMKFFPALDLNSQVEQAVESASQTDHQSWNYLDQFASDFPEVKTVDPSIAEDIDTVMEKLSQEIESSAKSKHESNFNSAELFVSVHDRELHLSNGFSNRNSQSRIYAEAAFSANRHGVTDEFLDRQWSVHTKQAQISDLFRETADRALFTTEVTPPKPGRYSVIIGIDSLATLFSDYSTHLSAPNCYHQLPFKEIGEDLVPNAKGDLISLRLDPFFEYGTNTDVVSSQGIAQKPLDLVKNNKVVGTIADKQFADYLGIPVSSVMGEMVVEPGQYSFESLTQQTPQVLEVLQFSALFTDANSGTFSSEIRLGRLHNNETGKVTYVKGGSLSGSIFHNFSDLKLGSECQHFSDFTPFSSNVGNGIGYYGPKFALLNDVSIAG